MSDVVTASRHILKGGSSRPHIGPLDVPVAAHGGPQGQSLTTGMRPSAFRKSWPTAETWIRLSGFRKFVPGYVCRAFRQIRVIDVSMRIMSLSALSPCPHLCSSKSLLRPTASAALIHRPSAIVRINLDYHQPSASAASTWIGHCVGHCIGSCPRNCLSAPSLPESPL